MRRKSGRQLSMDEVDQLTTSEAGHTDLAEIGNMGQSELLSTCKLLGTLRISRGSGCELLTRKGSSRTADLLRENCPTGCWFRISCASWCPWRWKKSVTSTTKQIRSCKEEEGCTRAALKLATQLLDTGGLFVRERPRGCQTLELHEMKMFQKRCGYQLLSSDLDACELGVRDETTRMLV